MPVCPKVILVTMFEPAGRAGELTLFRERMDLAPVELAGTGLGSVYLGHEGHLLALCAGVGTANTAVSLMALGLCPEVDTSESTWIIAGIGGGDPTLTTLGTPVWADWCVDGDFGFEIDAREIPSGWSTGILPLGAQEPFGLSNFSDADFGQSYQAFELNAELVAQAKALSENAPLDRAEDRDAYLASFGSDSVAAQAPAVTVGGNMASARYFHGQLATQWARRWMEHWSGGKSTFTSCGMEDTGSMHAIAHLQKLGLTQLSRVLILRTISNFTLPPPGECPTEHFHDKNAFPAFDLALENGYRVATAVIDHLLAEDG